MNLKEMFKDKVVLVVGGTGSIGSEIVRKLLAFPIRQVRILSRGEYKQFKFQQELKDIPEKKLSFLIGDIRDRERMFLAAEGVDMIFNAAAMKHVPLCETNPFEAIKTNVYGTQNLVDAARACDVAKYVHISTDKAAMPVNVMGATKLLAEKVALSAEKYKGEHRTVFCSVRFGNVFASRGSVVPLFIDQIKKGGPVTLTDREMTRFMMSIPQAAELVLKSAYFSRGSELFILKMPVMRIEDMAKGLIEIFAQKCGYKAANIPIKTVGKREGEKRYELLLTEEEAETVYENNEMYCVAKNVLPGFKNSGLKSYRSDKSRAMTYREVVSFLREMLGDQINV